MKLTSFCDENELTELNVITTRLATLSKTASKPYSINAARMPGYAMVWVWTPPTQGLLARAGYKTEEEVTARQRECAQIKCLFLRYISR